MFFYKILLISIIKLKKLFSKNKNTLESKALFISNAGIGDSIYLLSAIQYYAQLTCIKADILISSSSMDIICNSDYVNTIYLINDNKPIDFKQYKYIFSNRTDISSLVAIIKSGFSNYFIENPCYEKLRLISRIKCFISQKYKKKYFSQFHAGLVFNGILSSIFKSKIPPPKPNVLSKKPTGDLINNFLKENETYGIIHVAGGDEIRKLNPALIYKITEVLPCPIILVGNDFDLLVYSNINFKPIVFNGLSQFSLNEVLYLIENSVFCIAPDSSIMHLASLTNTKIIGIMGNALEDTFGPIFSSNKIILSRNAECSPCSKIKCKKYNGYSCVQDITIYEIVDAVYKSIKF